MVITFFVKRRNEKFIEGSLMINGEHVCDAVESTENSLSTGEYALSIDKCPLQKHQIIMVGSMSHTDCDRCTASDCAIKKVWDKENDLIANATDNDETSHDDLVKYEQSVRADSQKSLSELSRHVCHRIVTGNGVNGKNDGRIVVGKRIAPGIVINSKDVHHKLFKRMEKSIARGHTPILEIV